MLRAFFKLPELRMFCEAETLRTFAQTEIELAITDPAPNAIAGLAAPMFDGLLHREPA